MAQTAYTYKNEGVTAAYLAQQMPGSGTVSAAVPIQYQTITWESAYKDDLDAAMSAKGFTYDYAGTAPPAKVIAQIVPSFLTEDASEITVAQGWVDVRESTVVSHGGSSVGVQVTAICTGTVGTPQYRVVVNGGAYTNQVIGAASYDFPGGTSRQPVASHIPCPTTQAATYSFKLQVQAQGVLGTATPRAGSGITAVENK